MIRLIIRCKGGPGSGWYAPGRGTHTGEKHRAVGSGKAGVPTGKAKVRKVPAKSLAETIIRPAGADVTSAVDDEIERAMSTFGVSREHVLWQCRDSLQKYIDGSTSSIRVPASVMPAILDDGKVKNQHESGRSEAMMFDPGFRASAESGMFNVSESDKPSAYPIYGYLNNPKYTNIASDYGDVEVVLKDSVNARTTITVGDSMNYVFGGTIPQPSPLLAAKQTPYAWNGVVSALYRGRMSEEDGIQYVETQIHGGIKTSDISKVIFYTSEGKSGEHSSAQAALDRAGIPWEKVG